MPGLRKLILLSPAEKSRNKTNQRKNIKWVTDSAQEFDAHQTLEELNDLKCQTST